MAVGPWRPSTEELDPLAVAKGGLQGGLYRSHSGNGKWGRFMCQKQMILERARVFARCPGRPRLFHVLENSCLDPAGSKRDRGGQMHSGIFGNASVHACVFTEVSSGPELL